jgi:hypothetical protein
VERCEGHSLAELACRIGRKELASWLAGQKRVSVARQRNDLGYRMIQVLFFLGRMCEFRRRREAPAAGT